MRSYGVLVLLVVGLVGCSPEQEASDLAPERHGTEYVALGDSFTAAPGVGSPVGDDGCGRTDGNYPRRVADALDLDLVDMSCGAASSADLVAPQQVGGVQTTAQLDALSAETDVVTLRIGANDHDIFALMVFACVPMAVHGNAGESCAEEIDASLERATAELAPRLTGHLEEIAARAPNATVLVVGYPQVIPPEPPQTCAQLPLAAEDFVELRRYNEVLDDALRQAAEANGVDFIDVFEATAGHDICAPDPWVAGVAPERPATPYHPYGEEQQVTADLVVAALSGD